VCGLLRAAELPKTKGPTMRKVMLGAVLALTALAAQAQTDATAIATGAETAFEVVAPIVIAIATFFVVVRIAKRVTR